MGNEDAYLKKAIAVADGKEIILDEDKIIKRGDELSYPLKDIFKKVEIFLYFDEIQGLKRSSYVEIKLLKAGLQDLKENPNYEFLKFLKDLKEKSLNSYNFKEDFEKTLSYCSNQLKRELLYILYLLKGSHSERKEGIERLEKLIQENF